MSNSSNQQAQAVNWQQMGRVILASTLGTTIEWYDFFAYGTMAVLVFPKLFFPTSDPFVSTLLSLLTFLFGFIARPFGGALFGHFGDRIGRKATLVMTLSLMGVSTLAVGFIPSYATIGVAAPLILVILRLIQGASVGGEWGGSVLLAMEYGHKEGRGFWASWPQMGAPLGLVASTFMINIVKQNVSPADFIAYGWRIPFYVSAVLILIGLYIRLNILETPLFTQVLSQKAIAKAPVIDAIRHSMPEILLTAGARFAETAPFYLFATFAVTYGEHIKMNTAVILSAITYGALIECFTIPIFASLSDRIGRRTMLMIGSASMAAFAFPYFWLLNTADPVLVTIGIILSFALFHSWLYGPEAALIAERFGTRERFSGASLGYQLAAPLAGGFAPIIAFTLLTGHGSLAAMGLAKVTFNFGNGSYQSVAIYIVILGLISFLSAIGLKELTKADISSATEYIILAPEE